MTEKDEGGDGHGKSCKTQWDLMYASNMPSLFLGGEVANTIGMDVAYPVDVWTISTLASLSLCMIVSVFVLVRS